MKIIKTYFLILSLSILALKLAGQQSNQLCIANPGLPLSAMPSTFLTSTSFPEMKMATSIDFKSMRPNSILPAYKVTGIFCRMEHRIEATSNFAPRFRLGSVNYTDWMEGKKSLLSRYAK
jgi:hypothetical protein